MRGRKNDADKLRYDLIPPEGLEAVADVLTRGAKKYEDRNWEGGMRWGRVFAALLRHLWAWWRGEEYDKEDGQHHLASVIWCAMVLYTFWKRGVGEDDRPMHLLRSPTTDPSGSLEGVPDMQQRLDRKGFWRYYSGSFFSLGPKARVDGQG